jgi:hypothetical protein
MRPIVYYSRSTESSWLGGCRPGLKFSERIQQAQDPVHWADNRGACLRFRQAYGATGSEAVVSKAKDRADSSLCSALRREEAQVPNIER